MSKMSVAELKEANARSLWHPMAHPKSMRDNPPDIIARGEGSWIWDIDGNRLAAGRQRGLRPRRQRRLKRCDIHRLEHLVQRRDSGGLGAGEPQRPYCLCRLQPSPLRNGIEAARIGQHRRHRQRQDRGEGMPPPTRRTRVRHLGERLEQARPNLC